MLLGNDRGQDETPAIHGMVELVREILGRYSRSQETAQKLNAEVAELKSRLNKIDSQRGYGTRMSPVTSTPPCCANS